MADTNLQCDAPSVAIGVEVGAFDPKVSKKSRGIVRRLLEVEWTIHVGGAAVSLLVEGDDLPGLCKIIENPSERGVDGRPAAV